MPYDYGRWCTLAFVARFALNYKKVPVPTLSTEKS